MLALRRRPSPAPPDSAPSPARPSASPLLRRFGNREAAGALAGADPVLARDLTLESSGVGAGDQLDGTSDNSRVLRRMTESAAPDAISPTTSGGEPLSDELRARVETAFGRSFGHVRIHVGEAAAADLGAAAMALGSHVFFAPGQWAPGTREGDRLLAHELVHVVQHDQGRVPAGGGVSDPDDALEREAYALESSFAAGFALAAPGVPATPVAAPSSPGAAPALCRRHPYTHDQLEAYAVRLRGLGLADMDAATLAPLTGEPHEDSLEPEEIELAFTALAQAGGGVARGWNHGQDDLGARSGPGDTDHAYWTPLHYGLNLHRLAVASGATDYADFFRHHSGTIPLAGAPMHVHERGLWFVAAAQLGMDRAAGVPEDEHYAAPAALDRALRGVKRELDGIARTRLPTHPSERLGRSLLDRFEQARAELDQIRDLAELHRDRDRDADARGERHEEPEPFGPWFLEASRQAAIAAVHAPTDAATAVSAASTLSAALDGAPGRDHGMGAMDAHGTAHAMGLAIDYGTSGSSSAENRGVPATVWPFLYHLMDQSGPPLAGLRPHALNDLYDVDPDLAIALSDLMTDPGPHGAQQVHDAILAEVGADDGHTPAVRRELRHATAVAVRDSRAALRSVSAVLVRLGRGPTAALHDRVTALRLQVQADIRTMDSRSPEGLADLLDGWHDTLTALDADVRAAYDADRADERAWLERNATDDDPGPLPAGVRHRRTRSDEDSVLAALASLQSTRDSLATAGRTRDAATEVDGLLGTDAQAQWDRDQHADLVELFRQPGFRSWFRAAVRSGIFTQPAAYLEGIESVHAHGDGRTHFYGGHHWDVAPMAVITDDGAYRAALESDLSRRPPEDVGPIVGYLDGFPSGRAALDTDLILGAELDLHAPGWRDARASAEVSPPR